MANQGFNSFSSDAVTYIAEKTLMIAKKLTIFHGIGDPAQQPANNSKTFQYTRYDRLALPLSALSDGVTPNNTSMSISTVTAVADQWGAFINISDVAELTIRHPVLQKGIDLMGYQAAETIDREIIKVLLAGTSVSFPGSNTTRSALTSTSTDVMSSTLVRKVVATLRSNGAVDWDGSNYTGALDPFVEMDISADATFVLASQYSVIKNLLNGEVGQWMGVRWMRSNTIPVLIGQAAGTYASSASPVGTFTTANYRVTTAYYDLNTGFLVGLSQNSNVAMTSTQSLTGTTPSGSYVFKIFVSAAAAAATAIMYQGVETTYATDFIPASTAFSIVAPPASGDSIAGTDIPGSGKNVHFSWVIGKEAFAVVDLQKLQSYVTPNAASDSDPLAQRRKAGWKLMFKSVICNQNFVTRVETLSAFN